MHIRTYIIYNTFIMYIMCIYIHTVSIYIYTCGHVVFKYSKPQDLFCNVFPKSFYDSAILFEWIPWAVLLWGWFVVMNLESQHQPLVG